MTAESPPAWLTASGGQLPLDLSLRVPSTFGNLVRGGNGEAIDAVRGLIEDRATTVAGGVVLLHGERGSGKSHLLQAACHLAHSLALRAQRLSLAELSAWPEAALDGVERLDLLALDCLESGVGGFEQQQRLFSLYNRCRDAGCRLLIASRHPPAQLDLQLEDLRSRLQWGACYRLYRLDDQQLKQALQLRAEARGMQLDDRAANYLISRQQRDPAKLVGLLEQLDRASLAAGRRLTIPFLRQILGE